MLRQEQETSVFDKYDARLSHASQNKTKRGTLIHSQMDPRQESESPAMREHGLH